MPGLSNADIQKSHDKLNEFLTVWTLTHFLKALLTFHLLNLKVVTIFMFLKTNICFSFGSGVNSFL